MTSPLAGPTGPPPELSIFTEPTAPVARRWVAWLSLASVGTWSGFYGPIQVLLAQQAEAIAPADKDSALSLVLLVGAAVSTVANPLFGAFSDRTTLRVGRRVPWVVGGTVIGALAMLLLSVAHSVAVMALGWGLAQLGLNAMLAAISATVPDQVPTRQRGVVGGWLAIAQNVGVIAGAGLAAVTGSIAAGYVATAVWIVVLATPYVLDNRDHALPPEHRTPFHLGRFARSFWISPRVHPDFAWAWGTRFLMNLGNALLLLYLFYYLKDAVGLTDKEAESGVFLLTAIFGVVTVTTAIIGGTWSDRVERRKVFVIASGLIAAAALLLLAFVTTWTGAIVGAICLGLGYGTYTAVDFAMVTEVLPSPGDRAKDLGVINIASAMPQVLAPIVAGAILATGLGYSALYVLAAGVSFLGSVLVVQIRSLR